ncbi:MAG: FMN-binding protein [Clostridiales bacterium]|nr:FMN-binding protein [Clostridiales bacterium]
MKKGLLIGVLVLIVLVVSGSLIMLQKEKKEVNSLVYEIINMGEVADGYYEGEVSTTLISVKVGVLVKDNNIEEIEIIKHDNGMGAKAEAIIDHMVKNNTYDVDVVSGATFSSKVIKNAVNKALTKGINQ